MAQIVKLAIVIPAYNCEATIEDTVRSLQRIDIGWESVERVVVCDDASSDNTLRVLRSCTFDRCPLTVLRHQRNRGEAACYSTMIDILAHDTNWFLILHSDDVALPCFVKRNLEIVKQCDERVAAVSSNYYEFGDVNGFAERLAYSPAEDVIIFRGNAKHELHHTATVGCWWHISGSLINKKIWQQFGGRDPCLPQVGDWDLILRWQAAGYRVGHSLIPTTKCRVHGESVSARSYREFRDLLERTKVICDNPALFSRETRRKLAVRYGISAFRRVCRLLLGGRIKDSIHGISTGIKCIRTLLRDDTLRWLEALMTLTYRSKMYSRWAAEFGIYGVWRLLRCNRSRPLRYVYLKSRRFGRIVCRECPEDFAAINTVMCFGAYAAPFSDESFGSVLDLGANIGIATRYFLSKEPNLNVLAVEPSADNCSVFRMNVAIAEAGDRVQLWKCGIGPVEGKGFLKSDVTARFDSFQVEYSPNGEPPNGEHTIVVRAMGSVVRTLAGPILVKMDIEGSEHEVLACRADWIGKVGYMMIEFHDKENEKMWLSVLVAEGWKAEKHFDTWHFRKHT